MLRTQTKNRLKAAGVMLLSGSIIVVVNVIFALPLAFCVFDGLIVGILVAAWAVDKWWVA